MPKKSRNDATAVATQPMTFHAFVFEVEGEGRFPMELLGVEFCMPSDVTQYLVAFNMHTGPRRVELVGFRPRATYTELAPSLDRWIEVGWPVKESTLRAVPE